MQTTALATTLAVLTLIGTIGLLWTVEFELAGDGGCLQRYSFPLYLHGSKRRAASFPSQYPVLRS